jgi:phage gp16-like protein
MTARAAKGRSARSIELAKIHIAATDRLLIQPGDDSAYRDMLWSIGRVRSAAQLDAAGREAVLQHLRACGWKDTSPPRHSAGRYERGTQAALIRWLWTQLANAGAVRDSSDRALRRYIAQHSGVATSNPAPDELAPQHLKHFQARDVIEQLKRWLVRVEDRPA